MSYAGPLICFINSLVAHSVAPITDGYWNLIGQNWVSSASNFYGTLFNLRTRILYILNWNESQDLKFVFLIVHIWLENFSAIGNFEYFIFLNAIEALAMLRTCRCFQRKWWCHTLIKRCVKIDLICTVRYINLNLNYKKLRGSYSSISIPYNKWLIINTGRALN